MASRKRPAREPSFELAVAEGPHGIDPNSRRVVLEVTRLRSSGVSAAALPFYRVSLEGGLSSALGVKAADSNLQGCDRVKESTGTLLWTGCKAPLELGSVKDDGRAAYVTLEVFLENPNQPIQARGIELRYPVSEIDDPA
jgi:hypothetical protein